METNAPATTGETTAIPAGLRQLWHEARGWVGWLFGMFDRNTLRTTGVSREHGARLNIWLINIESAVRRLILAAALAFTPPALRRAPAIAAARTQPQHTSPRRAGFRVFRLAAGEAAPRRPTTRREPKPYGHIPFRPDPLLNLGATHRIAPHTTGGAITRTRNPLDRWVRLSRDDPDWRPADEQVLAPAWSEPPPAHRLSHAQRTHREPAAPDASLADWHRHHDAWTTPVPAPDLAARLEALERVAADPAAAIASAARRLRLSRDRTLMLAAAALPHTHPPNRAAHIDTMGHTSDFAARCHKLIAPDTS